MKLWKMVIPNYVSERQERINNGALTFSFSLPGVACCNSRGGWGGGGISEKHFPIELQHIPEFQKRWPIPPERLLELKMLLKNYSEFKDVDIWELTPGLSFQPACFKPPTKNEHDFLWPSISGLVVSLRIASLLKNMCSDDVALVPLEPRCNWVQVIVKKKSQPPRERVSDKFCHLCGRGNKVTAPSKFEFHIDMIPDAQIFFMGTTFEMYITEELMRELVALEASNVFFKEIFVHQ
jgi:hypothetical protein